MSWVSGALVSSKTVRAIHGVCLLARRASKARIRGDGARSDVRTNVGCLVFIGKKMLF